MLPTKKENLSSDAPAELRTGIARYFGCGIEAQDRLVDGAASEHHPKGKILFISGDKAKSYFYIRSGWVKTFRETLDGAQAIIDILPTGHIFGETSLFEDDTYPYSAEIVEDADIVRLPLAALKSEIHASNVLALSMLKSMARYRREQDKEVEHRTLQNAPQRIGCFLLRLSNQCGSDGPVHIHLPYDKTLVAARLGMQPETFSRALARLKDAVDLKIKGASIEIESIQQLAEFSCSACTSHFPCKDK